MPIQTRNNRRKALNILILIGGCEGKMRLGTAATLLGITEELEGRLEHISFPFFVAVGGRERIVDPTGPEEFFRRAGTAAKDKVFKKYETAQHALLAEPLPLRAEIEVGNGVG